MKDILTLPPGSVGEGFAETGRPPGRDTAAAVLREARAAFAARTDLADDVRAAFDRLTASPSSGIVHGDAGPGGGHARDLAADLLARDEVEEAAPLLASLCLAPDTAADGLLGLAIGAARRGQFADGLALAEASRAAGTEHPRARLVAAFCELELGNKRSAQSHLAIAARMARRSPEFRDDLREAQRMLLTMHLT